LPQCSTEQHALVNKSEDLSYSVPANAKDEVMPRLGHWPGRIRNVIPTVAYVVDPDLDAGQALPVHGDSPGMIRHVLHGRDEQGGIPLPCPITEPVLTPA
jgi:hypothetical protein